MKNKNKQTIGHILKNNRYLLRICFKADPKYVILSIVEMIRNELVIFLEFTLGLNYILECAEFGRPFKDAAIFLIELLAFVVLGLLFNAYLYQKIKMKSELKIKQALKEMLYLKAKEIDLECYDNPEFYNSYVLAVSEAENQVDRMFGMMNSLFTGVTSVLLSGTFFIMNDPISFIFVAISFVALFFAGKAFNKLNVKIRIEKNPFERKLGYINRVFYLNDYAKEIRLNTNISDEFLSDFDKTNDEIFAVDKANARKRFGLKYLKDYICNNLIIDVVYMIYLVYSAAVLHRISYSNVAVMRGTANRLKNRMGILSNVYPKAEEISMYVEKILDFLSIEPKIFSTQNRENPRKPTKIELKNVSFGYNKKDGYILKNISMKINPNSKIAIVGYNGAGKTTLIKLIMRLYDPNEGEILLDGVNIKEYNLREETNSFMGRRWCSPISIHSSHKGRDTYLHCRYPVCIISIHSSHKGRDVNQLHLFLIVKLFQSTLPIREETAATFPPAYISPISIHFSHKGRDGLYQVVTSAVSYFNPLFP